MSSDQPRILDLSPLVAPPAKSLWLTMVFVLSMFLLILSSAVFLPADANLSAGPAANLFIALILMVFFPFIFYLGYRFFKYFWLNKMVRRVIRGEEIPQLKHIFLSESLSADKAVAHATRHLKKLAPVLEKIQTHKKTSIWNKLGFYAPLALVISVAMAADAWIIYKTNLFEEPVMIISSITGALLLPFMFMKRRQRLQLDATALLRIDDRQPVVHLRSFGDDELNVKTIAGDATKTVFGRIDLKATLKTRLLWTNVRLEEALAGIARSFGPFIAIGEPNEALPDIGAARAYLGDDQWQDKVAQWMDKSLLITMIGGTTPGLMWELDHLLKTGQPGKLIIFFPPSKLKLMRLLRPVSQGPSASTPFLMCSSNMITA